MVRCLLGGVQDDTVGRRYRRAEIERGEADAIQENGDPDGGQYGANREEKQRLYKKTRIPSGAVRRQ